MKIIQSSMFVAYVVIFALPCASFACDTEQLELTGNLNSSAELQAAPQNPDSFAKLSSRSQFSSVVPVFDAAGYEHNLFLFFFHTHLNRWTVQAYVDSDDLGSSAGQPTKLGSATLRFSSTGERTNFSPPDLDLAISWKTTSAEGTIAINFPLTQNASASYIDSTTQQRSSLACAQSGHGDFDRDGITDLAIYRPEWGMWAILKSSTGNQEYIWKQWGLPGDYPMAGDYTGDGQADLVVWRPVNGNWYICSSDTGYDCTQGTVKQFGLPGDKPIAGDFDGDRIFDYAVWRPAYGLFIYERSSDKHVVVRQWGLPRDIPLGSGTNN